MVLNGIDINGMNDMNGIDINGMIDMNGIDINGIESKEKLWRNEMLIRS
jgi:hypothetical protein